MGADPVGTCPEAPPCGRGCYSGINGADAGCGSGLQLVSSEQGVPFFPLSALRRCLSDAFSVASNRFLLGGTGADSPDSAAAVVA